MEVILFYFFSVLALLSALLVIFLPQPTRALLSLIVTMFSLAVLFLLLGAYMIAMVHLIVYAGAVLVLFLFVIMLQGIGAREVPLKNRFHLSHILLALISGGVLGNLLLSMIKKTVFDAPKNIPGTVEVIGRTLFQAYLLPFELTSIVLLLGIFAAVALAKRENS